MVYGVDECDSYDIFKFELVNQICFEFADSCRRAMCECYKRFYNQLLIRTGAPIERAQCSADDDYHSIACCSNLERTSPFNLYDADRVKCRQDGSVAEIANDYWKFFKVCFVSNKFFTFLCYDQRCNLQCKKQTGTAQHNGNKFLEVIRVSLFSNVF